MHKQDQGTTQNNQPSDMHTVGVHHVCHDIERHVNYGDSGGHTGGASGAVHQGPRPLGAHQRGPDSNFLEKLISSVSHVASHSGYCREIVF